MVVFGSCFSMRYQAVRLGLDGGGGARYSKGPFSIYSGLGVSLGLGPPPAPPPLLLHTSTDLHRAPNSRWGNRINTPLRRDKLVGEQNIEVVTERRIIRSTASLVVA